MSGETIGEVWAVVDPCGRIEASSDWATPEHAWRVVLGWPTKGYVRDKQAQGWRCIRVQVTAVDEA